MNQSLLKPKILILATALAAGTAGAQSTAMSYAPCANLQGVALSDCLKQNAGTSSAAGAGSYASGGIDTALSVKGGSTIPSGMTRPVIRSGTGAIVTSRNLASDTSVASGPTPISGTSSASAPSSGPVIPGATGNPLPNDSTQQSTSSSATNLTGAPHGTKAHPSEATRTHNRYRAELRSCAQLTGNARNSCIDRAINQYGQS